MTDFYQNYGSLPSCEGKNPCLDRDSYLPFMRPVIPLDDGTFCVLMSLKNYGDDQRILTRKATYKDIYDWVRKTYGVPVRYADISRAKQRCGLAYTKLNRPASSGYEPPLISMRDFSGSVVLPSALMAPP